MKMKAVTLNTEQVTRVEIIDDTGRVYVTWGITSLELQLQDDDRTLKIFLSKQ
jgi:hypothetical protein